MQSRPKILFISSARPNAFGIGVEQRAWSHLDCLNAVGCVDLVLAVKGSAHVAPEESTALLSKCRSVTILNLEHTKVKSGRSIPGWALANKLLRFGRPSVAIPKGYRSEPAPKKIRTTYELTFCFRISSYQILKGILADRSIFTRTLHVDFDDIESLAQKRQIKFLRRQQGKEKSLVAWIAAMETRLLERTIQREADYVSVCSTLDQERLLSRSGKAKICVIPNSFRIKCPLPERGENARSRLLFVGTMNYRPNEDAALYFATAIFPQIRAALNKEVEFYIVGRYPHDRVKALNTPGVITVTGGVDDVEPYYRDADLVVVPIRFGGGTRIKILEALAYARPVISTPLGAEGLDLSNGKEIIIADDETSLARHCVELLQSPERMRALAIAGRLKVEKRYSYDAVQSSMRAQILAML